MSPKTKVSLLKRPRAVISRQLAGTPRPLSSFESSQSEDAFSKEICPKSARRAAIIKLSEKKPT